MKHGRQRGRRESASRRGRTRLEARAAGLPATHLAAGDGLADLEVLRRGIGLLPPANDSEPGLATIVLPEDAGQPATRSCTCKASRERTCRHQLLLGERLREAERRWGGLAWEAGFATTLWGRLAPLLFAGERGRAVSVELRRLAGGGVEVRGHGGEARILVLDSSASGQRLVDRLVRLGDVAGRASLLDRLALLQITPEERLLLDAGMPSVRQAREASLARRLAYHVVREHGDPGGTFHPVVDLETGELQLTFRDPDGTDRYRFTVPREQVRAMLGLLAAAFPGQQDLAAKPIPLRSLFLVSRATEVDLELRPVIQALQQQGEARLLASEALERFRYGDLVYLPELGVLGELERPGRPRRFTAPRRMVLSNHQLPQVAGELAAAVADGEVVLDRGVTLPRLLAEPGNLALDVGTADEGGWYWLSATYGEGAGAVSLGDLLRGKREGRSVATTPNGDWIDLGSPALGFLAGLAARPAMEIEDSDGRLRLAAVDLLRLAASSTGGARVLGPPEVAARLRRLLELRPPRPFSQPVGLCSPLRPYQRLGAEWLSALWHYRLGGLLCDDMGLGKTHQAMALLLLLVEESLTDLPSLVVTPLTVLGHWQQKLAEHAPTLPVAVFHGPRRDLQQTSGTRLVLTSYGTLRAAAETLADQPFAVVVFDEAQQLKNRQTQGYRAARALSAEVRIGLTGTPIENDLADLHALVDLVLPGALDHLEPASRGAGRAFQAESLRRAARPFVLRRVKAEVLGELPEKINDPRRCRLSDEQVALYREVVERRGPELRERLSRPGERIPYLHVFAVLNLLKRICDHPALALGRLDRWQQHSSGKWDLFCELLGEALGSGQKVVVFSQYLGMLEIMGRHLTALGTGHATLTGSSRGRAETVDRFNRDEGCRVFLGSLKAGGTGIDLVGGSVVIHYDRWWNAAREDQATDRVHRIGQRRAVQVLRLIAEGTLEERIDGLIEGKRRLLDEVVETDSAALSRVFGRAELLALLAPLVTSPS